MHNFSYVAKSLDGEDKKGVLAAEDERQLAQFLRADGMILIFAETKEKKKILNFDISSLFGHVPVTELIMITRNLAVMFSTGLSLVKSFDILAGQAKNKNVKVAMLDIKERVNKGENFSDALAVYPKNF